MSARLFKRLRAGASGKLPLEAPMRRPPCFNTQRDFDAWMRESKRFAAMADVNPKNYCIDCLPDYQRRMKAAGRCAHPEVEFANHDGGVYGVRPPIQRAKG
jgi:hypothetical protein